MVISDFMYLVDKTTSYKMTDLISRNLAMRQVLKEKK